jgi:hypothetical protein
VAGLLLAVLGAACSATVEPIGPADGARLDSGLTEARARPELGRGDAGPPDGARPDGVRTEAAPPGPNAALQPPTAPLPLGFWCGPPEAFITVPRYQEVLAAGFTFLMPPCEGWATVERNRKILDTALAAGLTAYLADARMPLAISGVADATVRLDQIVADYGAHPALTGYFVTDEPGAAAFAGLAEVVAYLRAKDPTHPAYINLLPSYASTDQLGTPTYAQHVEQFIQTVKPAVISYDHYHFLTTGDRPGFFANLATVRDLALKYGLPFWQIVLVVPHMGYRSPTEAEKRWEALHTLVYGGKGVMDFTYWTPPDPIFGPAIIAGDGTPTSHYAEIQRINARVQAIGRHLVPAVSTGVFQSGDLAPGGTIRPPFAPVMVTQGGSLTVGTFEAGSFSYVLLVNRDYQAAVATAVQIATGSAPLFRLDPASNTWQAAPGTPQPDGTVSLPLSLGAGDGELFRVDGKLAAGPPGAEAVMGRVRADYGTMYLVDSQHGLSFVAPGGWNTCFDGFTLAGTVLHSNGFWLCARADLAGRAFYVGNVVADGGYYYRVQGGTVTDLGYASWNTCPPGSTLIGTFFESNGFWICLE